MLIASDLKNSHVEAPVTPSQITYAQVDLLNTKNIDLNITLLKKSLKTKNKFLDQYNYSQASTLCSEKRQIRTASAFEFPKNIFFTNSTIDKKVKSNSDVSNCNDLENYYLTTNLKTPPARLQSKCKNVLKLSSFPKRIQLQTKVNDDKLLKEITTSKQSTINQIPHFRNSSIPPELKRSSSFFQSETAINTMYNSVFDKNLQQIIRIKQRGDKSTSSKGLHNSEETTKSFAHKSFINKEIVEAKKKLYLMKGVIDYIFPKILVNKVQRIKNTRNKKELVDINEIPLEPVFSSVILKKGKMNSEKKKKRKSQRVLMHRLF